MRYMRGKGGYLGYDRNREKQNEKYEPDYKLRDDFFELSICSFVKTTKTKPLRCGTRADEPMVHPFHLATDTPSRTESSASGLAAAAPVVVLIKKNRLRAETEASDQRDRPESSGIIKDPTS